MCLISTYINGGKITIATLREPTRTVLLLTMYVRNGSGLTTAVRARVSTNVFSVKIYPGKNENDEDTVTVLLYSPTSYSIATTVLSSNFGLMLKNLQQYLKAFQSTSGVKNAVIQEYMNNPFSPKTTIYIHSSNPLTAPDSDYYRMNGFNAAEKIRTISCGGLSVVKTENTAMITFESPKRIVTINTTFRYCMCIGPSGIALVKLEEDFTLNLYWFSNGDDLVSFLRSEGIVEPFESNIIVTASNGLAPFACAAMTGQEIAINELIGMFRGFLGRYVERIITRADCRESDIYNLNSMDDIDEYIAPVYKIVNPYIIGDLAINPFDGNIIFREWWIYIPIKVAVKFLRLSLKYITIGTYSQIYQGVIEEPYNVINAMVSVLSQTDNLINSCDLNVYNLFPVQVAPIFTHMNEIYRVMSNGRIIRTVLSSILYANGFKCAINNNQVVYTSTHSSNIQPLCDFDSPFQEPGRNGMAFASANGNWIKIETLIINGILPTTKIIASHGRYTIEVIANGFLDFRIFGNYLIVYGSGYRVMIWKLTPNFANFIDIITGFISNKIAPNWKFVGAQVSISSHILFACPIASNTKLFRLNLNDENPETRIFAEFKIMSIFREIDIDPNDVYYYLSSANKLLNIVTMTPINGRSTQIASQIYYLTVFRV